MIEIRKSQDRGYIQHGWLDTYHTFSFSEYYDPKWMRFRHLRVINEDRIAANSGFPMHAHSDMEILTCVLKGKLEHKDSMGNGSIIHAGDVQMMSAGTGVEHSEFNPSKDEEVHLFQIWIYPEKKGLTPSYNQMNVKQDEKQNKLKLIVSPDARSSSIKIHQDAYVYISVLDEHKKLIHNFSKNRYGWLQLAYGTLKCNGIELHAGDGLMIREEEKIEMEAFKACEFLLFDLA